MKFSFSYVMLTIFVKRSQTLSRTENQDSISRIHKCEVRFLEKQWTRTSMAFFRARFSQFFWLTHFYSALFTILISHSPSSARTNSIETCLVSSCAKIEESCLKSGIKKLKISSFSNLISPLSRSSISSMP